MRVLQLKDLVVRSFSVSRPLNLAVAEFVNKRRIVPRLPIERDKNGFWPLPTALCFCLQALPPFRLPSHDRAASSYGLLRFSWIWGNTNASNTDVPRWSVNFKHNREDSQNDGSRARKRGRGGFVGREVRFLACCIYYCSCVSGGRMA